MKKAILRVLFKPLTIINRIKKKDEKAASTASKPTF